MQWRFLDAHPAVEPRSNPEFQREHDEHQCRTERNPYLGNDERYVFYGFSRHLSKHATDLGLAGGFAHRDDHIHRDRDWEWWKHAKICDDHGDCGRGTDDSIQRFPYFDHRWWVRNADVDDGECDVGEYR